MAECGIEGPPAMNKIVGGVEAAENQWPWQVALFIDDAWFCGGSLISENYVLTAAHCVDGASSFDIVAGAHNIQNYSEPHRVEITSFYGFSHPDWDPNTLANDIALIELPSPIEFNDWIKPSCLPAIGDIADEGELVTVTGWGKPSDPSSGFSPVLRVVFDLPIISNDQCFSYYGTVGEGFGCFDTSEGKGSCQVRQSFSFLHIYYFYAYQTEARNPRNTEAATNPVFDLLMTSNDLNLTEFSIENSRIFKQLLEHFHDLKY